MEIFFFFSAVSGICFGFLYGVAVFRVNNPFWKIVIGFLFAVIFKIIEFLVKNNDDDLVDSFVENFSPGRLVDSQLYFIFFLLTFLVTIIGIAWSYVISTPGISFFQVFLQLKEVQQIKSNVQKIQDLTKEKEAKERDLKEIQRKVDHSSKKLKSLNRKSEEQIRVINSYSTDGKSQYLGFPLDYEIVPLMSSSFISQIPLFSESLCSFQRKVESSTNDVIRQFKKEKEKRRQKMDDFSLIRGYFIQLCSFIADFHNLSVNNGRVHVRVYSNNCFHSFAVSINGMVADQSITPICIDGQNERNMIIKSFEKRTPMIKSYNLDHHFPTRNAVEWNDYLTISISNVQCDNKPLLSFGVSIKNVDADGEKLLFGAFLPIQTILEKSILELDSTISLENFVPQLAAVNT